MKLDFKGHDRVRYVPASAEEIRKASDGREENGYFHHYGDWAENSGTDVLTISFKPTSLINSALAKAASEKVKIHEERHFQDFKSRAIALRDAVNDAIKHKRDAQMDARWEWFLYDVKQDANAFHRKEGRMTEILFAPSTKRP